MDANKFAGAATDADPSRACFIVFWKVAEPSGVYLIITPNRVDASVDRRAVEWHAIRVAGEAVRGKGAFGAETRV